MMVDVRRSRARDVGIILVLALLAVDAVLVVMALRSPPAPPEVTVADNPPVVATTEPAVEPTPTPTETATPTPEPVPPASGRELPLSVLDAERAMRSVQPGTCADGGGVVEFTEDGG
ncbi:MAG TPA: hypothetical protein VK894_00145, partial [Jiangellales bacterium]|nr:hypothetical protein [Jiangellales bacterium]